MIALRKLYAMILLLFLGGPLAAGQDTLTVYSDSEFPAEQALWQQFAEANGIALQAVIENGDSLAARLNREGAAAADVIILSDVLRLEGLKAQKRLRPDLKKLPSDAVPKHFRDAGGSWVGLTYWAYGIIYFKPRPPTDPVENYRDLTAERWKGQILPGGAVEASTRTLLAGMIARQGRKKTAQWAAGLVANITSRPGDSDVKRILSIASRQGRFALINTAALALLADTGDDLKAEVAKSIALRFPDQDSKGALLNLRGAGIAAGARHPEMARRFIEYLTGESVQQQLGEIRQEFPVRPGVPLSKWLQAWGSFKADTASLGKTGKHLREAEAILRETGWPEGRDRVKR